ncbi:hypothetical protein HPB50_015399 [Hyalomma asiaticum]|uniref:Uncharacterized protein n=1 Tax=Hyalomma asiaticum TaxID=266040 RepID=A0ACB7TGZ8_HYAAI|nr:hypothetical protein HPB50_015399 [Hyalomma asiaticum]
MPFSRHNPGASPAGLCAEREKQKTKTTRFRDGAAMYRECAYTHTLLACFPTVHGPSASSESSPHGEPPFPGTCSVGPDLRQQQQQQRFRRVDFERSRVRHNKPISEIVCVCGAAALQRARCPSQAPLEKQCCCVVLSPPAPTRLRRGRRRLWFAAATTCT